MKLVTRVCGRVAIVLTALLSTAHAATPIITNGDFETGTLTGWTSFGTLNGYLTSTYGSGDVVSFDTDGDGIASQAARFQVGQAFFDSTHTPRGGGISQSFSSLGGLFSISVAIASVNTAADLNSAGGLFDLLLDGNVVTSYDFDEIESGGIERSTLQYSGTIAAGTHELAIRMLRGFTTTATTPFQYVDNVVIAAVPEPAAAAMWGLGIALLIGVRRTQANKARA